MPPSETPLERRLRLAHQARRAKEHQLDDIRRALCDVGIIEDDDPYGHADLADVIRQTLAQPGYALTSPAWAPGDDHKRCDFTQQTAGGPTRCIFRAGHPPHGHTMTAEPLAATEQPTEGPDPARARRFAETANAEAYARLAQAQVKVEPTVEEQRDAAWQRIELARQALAADGYFQLHQIGPDIAPRIIERLSALRNELEAAQAASSRASNEAEAPEFAQAPDGSWTWRCNGGPGCDGWVGLELFSEDAARREYQRHVDREHNADQPCVCGHPKDRHRLDPILCLDCWRTGTTGTGTRLVGDTREHEHQYKPQEQLDA